MEESNTTATSGPTIVKEKSVETKLGELMMQGWTMLSDACFMESCSTPLMRDNATKQVYCVGCEAWVFAKERTAKKCKYTDLVSLEGKRNLACPQKSEVSKLSKPIHITGNYQSFREMLEGKLIIFGQWLQNETDISKCNLILDAMKKTMDLLKEIPTSA
jgi:uncharacterized Zn finger protein (UPF0148 family)